MSQATLAREPTTAPAALPPARTPPSNAAATAPTPRLNHDFSTVGLRPGAPVVEDSWIPGYVLDQIRSLVRSIPGYTLVSTAIRQDPLTGQPVTPSLKDAVEALLLEGPFGQGVAAALETMNVLGAAWEIVSETLAEHRITIARVASDIRAAWDLLRVANGIEGNVAIVRGYVSAFLSDIRAAVRALVGRLIAAVRAVVVPLVEPYLTRGTLAPVWNLAIKVLHHNPLTGAEVTASTTEIIADFLTLIGKPEVLAQMTERGTLQQTADWLDGQIGTFLALLGRAKALFSEAWDAISPENLSGLLDTLPNLANKAVALFDDVRSFAKTLIGQVLTFIRDSLLGMLSEHAHGVRGFKLLTVILGRNPLTKTAVERTPENLIGGFVELVAGQDTYAQLSESGVIADAAARIESEMTRLNISWDLILETFRAIWEGLSLADFLNPIGAITRVISEFGAPLGRILSFAATVIQVVIELLLRLMKFPSGLLADIVVGVQQALKDIKADPVLFMKNLLATLKQGFSQFFDHITTHLVQGLADWLFRGLRSLGIEIPAELSGESILKLALDVMGLSIDFLWECLGEVIGPERVTMIRGAVDRLGEAWAFISDVQVRGMVAIWDYISSQLSNLWDTILSLAEDWLMSNLIKAAVGKVLSMLDPTGVMAVVNSAVAFFRAVESVIEYVTEILMIVKTYVDTLAAIAAGNLAPGAAMLENGLANAIPVAIGFLASQVGLGNVPEKIAEIIKGLRQTIKDAVVWLIRQAMRLGEAALNALGLGARSTDAPIIESAGEGLNLPNTRKTFAMNGESHSLWIEHTKAGYQVYIASQTIYLRDRINTVLHPKEGRGPSPKARLELEDIHRTIWLLEQDIAESDRGYARGVKELKSAPLGGHWFTEPMYRKAVLQTLSEYRKTLEGIGARYRIRDLTDLGHRSRYVLEEAIDPAYRSYPRWRNTFYGRWKGGVEETMRRDAHHRAIIDLASRDPGTTLLSDRFVYYCVSCRRCYSAQEGAPGFEFRRWHIDHIEPVAGNFVISKGLSQTQSDRESWYNRQSNLRVLCETCNTSKGSTDDKTGQRQTVKDWRVGRRFRGPNDAGPDPRDDG